MEEMGSYTNVYTGPIIEKINDVLEMIDYKKTITINARWEEYKECFKSKWWVYFNLGWSCRHLHRKDGMTLEEWTERFSGLKYKMCSYWDEDWTVDYEYEYELKRIRSHCRSAEKIYLSTYHDKVVNYWNKSVAKYKEDINE